MNYLTPSFIDKQKTVFKRVALLKHRATKEELIVKKFLDESKIKYIFQKSFIKDYYCIVDFYIPKPFKLVIEADGGYHTTEDQRKKDYRKDQYLMNRGFDVLRITNVQIHLGEFVSMINNKIKHSD